MLIVDAHLDLAWNALQWNRDLTRPAHLIRTSENMTPGKGRAQGTVALPDMRRGEVALCVATLLARSTGTAVPHLDYLHPAQAGASARGQLAYYRALERLGLLRVVEDAAALDAHWAAWEAAERPKTEDEPPKAGRDEPAFDEQGTRSEAEAMPGGRALVGGPSSFVSAGGAPPLGAVLSMEGADPILEPEDLAEWHAAGLRLLGPAHYGPGRYAGGTGTELGFSEIGLELLTEMRRLGMALDVTHLTDAGFWQALEYFDGPVLASHSNCRALVPHQRQLDDGQIRALAERGAVIGAALDAWMLLPGWVGGQSTNAQVTLEQVADQIDHVCQLTGSARHAAIGSDLDGGFGREQSPRDLDTVADLQRIAGLLAARGYAPDDIALVMHGNWLRLLRAALPAPR